MNYITLCQAGDCDSQYEALCAEQHLPYVAIIDTGSPKAYVELDLMYVGADFTPEARQAIFTLTKSACVSRSYFAVEVGRDKALPVAQALADIAGSIPRELLGESPPPAKDASSTLDEQGCP